ncbi:hypothetical protein F2P81_023726 [Scophthalmus maximus]|uniref:Uncharacterized protein n=1 Tax=Scophthalmus maximus TaxID=52904 RepID=A0A6A4RKT2_SCOMX|nr:hypothetical protein F2P81_023726 [Scophthalmus maximus]
MSSISSSYMNIADVPRFQDGIPHRFYFCIGWLIGSTADNDMMPTRCPCGGIRYWATTYFHIQCDLEKLQHVSSILLSDCRNTRRTAA